MKTETIMVLISVAQLLLTAAVVQRLGRISLPTLEAESEDEKERARQLDCLMRYGLGGEDNDTQNC